MKYNLNWSVGFCDSREEKPKEFFSVTVPGAVQLDYAKAYNLPDYNRELNYKNFKWMEDKFWVYTSKYDATKIKDGNNIFLVIKGIDYKYEIYANGGKICEYEGMYKLQELDLTSFAGKIIDLEIVIYPIPRSTMPNVHKDSRDEANQSCKPAVSYGWDFHPRLVPLGIWEDIYIEETKRAEIAKPQVSYKLSKNLKSADVTLFCEGFADTKWEFEDTDGKVIFSETGDKVTFTLDNVKLWWCNGYGEQPLYSWSANVDGFDTFKGKTGFKKIELVKAEGSWEENLNYPMSRNTPPITVRLNNTVIFAKGTNWVCPEIFYGTLTYERFRDQLELVKNGNFNFVRCWGGAVINKTAFFDICDELGILVWQEFPLACNQYQSTDEYISVFKSEAEAIIDKLRSHVCLMLWCGGNELFNNWSCMTEQDDAIRIMNKLTYEKTPGIPFISTAPVMGMAHGPYYFNMRDGREVIDLLINSHATAYTEFGGAGFSTKETLEQITDLDNLMPMVRENEIALAHGGHWLDLRIERYFGKVDTLDELIKCGQYIQCVGQQFIFEEARRQKPYCGMVSNWCFNEPWPNTGNNSLVSYPNSIKPAYYAVAKACRKVLASARYKKLSYIAGETLDFDLFLLNDSLEKLSDGTVKVYIKLGDNEKVNVLNWDYSDVKICTNVAGPTVRYQLPYDESADTVEIILECGEYSSKYTLLYRVPEKKADAPKKMNAILNENA